MAWGEMRGPTFVSTQGTKNYPSFRVHVWCYDCKEGRWKLSFSCINVVMRTLHGVPVKKENRSDHFFWRQRLHFFVHAKKVDFPNNSQIGWIENMRDRGAGSSDMVY